MVLSAREFGPTLALTMTQILVAQLVPHTSVLLASPGDTTAAERSAYIWCMAKRTVPDSIMSGYAMPRLHLR